MIRDDLLLNPGSAPSPNGGSWNRLQDKIFERALVMFPEGTPDRWGKVATQVPGKSVSDIREHYEALIHDVSEIEEGRVQIPNYAGWGGTGENQISFGGAGGGGGGGGGGGRTKDGESERKKGVPWTPEEHRRFLIGLEKYGKGDWRSISRHSVLTRTPTQVASHAQKYYLRLHSQKKEKKRSSIHDITSAGISLGDPSEADSAAGATHDVFESFGRHPPFFGQSDHGVGPSSYSHF